MYKINKLMDRFNAACVLSDIKLVSRNRPGTEKQTMATRACDTTQKRPVILRSNGLIHQHLINNSNKY